MPGLRLDSDGDYIDDGEGFFDETNTAEAEVRHVVLSELETWVGDLQAGRVQRGIQGRNASETEAVLERESLVKGLGVLQAAGLIDQIEVDVTKVSPTRFSVGVRTRDTQSGGTIELNEIAEFGV